MAEKRMFSKKVIQTDDFLSLSIGAQVCYIHLSMAADDDGLLNNADSVMRMVGCSRENLDELIRAGYILPILPKVYAITHWCVSNHVQKDRYQPSIIADWKRYLTLEDKVYKLKERY